MKVKKILALGLLVVALVSVLAISASAAAAIQIAPGIPEFRNDLDANPSGYAEYMFGTVDTEVFFRLDKGNLFNRDAVYGRCWAVGEDAKACEIRVKVWASNWLTGEKIYEEENGGLAGSEGSAYYNLEFECDLWYGVTDTYHEGTVIHQDGSRSVMWVTGYTN